MLRRRQPHKSIQMQIIGLSVALILTIYAIIYLNKINLGRWLTDLGVFPEVVAFNQNLDWCEDKIESVVYLDRNRKGHVLDGSALEKFCSLPVSYKGSPAKNLFKVRVVQVTFVGGKVRQFFYLNPTEGPVNFGSRTWYMWDTIPFQSEQMGQVLSHLEDTVAPQHQ